jgi:hypothetical protein
VQEQIGVFARAADHAGDLNCAQAHIGLAEVMRLHVGRSTRRLAHLTAIAQPTYEEKGIPQMSGLRSVATTFDHVDVLIVGAGISGIGLGCHLVMKQPGRTFAIVDRRDAIGGTWDLFRYPGIRSDADLHTFITRLPTPTRSSAT